MRPAGGTLTHADGGTRRR